MSKYCLYNVRSQLHHTQAIMSTVIELCDAEHNLLATASLLRKSV